MPIRRRSSVSRTWRAAALSEFRDDHPGHITDLAAILRNMGRKPPAGGNVQRQGRDRRAAGRAGDPRGERCAAPRPTTPTRAYERAVNHRDASGAALPLLQQCLVDERRHCEWVLAGLDRLR
jgi:hypothetical protein